MFISRIFYILYDFFFFSLLFGFVSVVFFDHEISEFMRLGCMREKTWEMGHGLFVKWAMT